MPSARLLAPFLVLSTITAGCGAQSPVDPGALAELERAQARWLAARPDRYTYGIERLCFCATEALGPVTVRVEGDAVAERVYTVSGDPVAPTYEELFPSVDGLFEILRGAIEDGAFSIRVTYDPDSGVPLDFYIDYLEMAVDEELGMRVTQPVEAAPEP